MPAFFALVDAMPGREADVEAGLKASPRVTGLIRCRERSHDFLIRFDAPAFDRVDDFLQTHVRTIGGVAGIEVITDWDDHGQAVRDARATIG